MARQNVFVYFNFANGGFFGFGKATGCTRDDG